MEDILCVSISFVFFCTFSYLTLSNPILSNPILDQTDLFYSILLYYILIYFNLTLFYFLLGVVDLPTIISNESNILSVVGRAAGLWLRRYIHHISLIRSCHMISNKRAAYYNILLWHIVTSYLISSSSCKHLQSSTGMI